MILTCPSCGTQYVVKDGAIPPGGRQVRCASCKHSWHQDPETEAPEERTLEETADEASEAAEADNVSQEQDRTIPDEPAEEAGSEDWSEPEAFAEPTDVAEPASVPETATGDWFPAPDDDFAPFGQREEAAEVEARSPLLKLLLVVLLVAAIAAAFWFLAPAELKARLGIAQAGEGELQLMLTRSQRQPLASGNVLLAVTGRVINPTDESQPVPPIQAQLRNTSGKLVYSWTISPPASTIPPGGRAPFNSAEVNVPSEGELLTIAFAPPRA